MKLSIRAAALAALLVPAASAQNMLANPDFENGLTGWNVFGNAFPQTDNGGQFVARSGTGLVSMFGNFSGGFDVSGIFQEFPANPGDTFTIDAWSRHFSGDALTGGIFQRGGCLGQFGAQQLPQAVVDRGQFGPVVHGQRGDHA